MMADALSRLDPVGDYSLRKGVYQSVVQEWQLSPSIDLLADSSNFKCPRFIALPGPQATGAIAQDPFRYSWRGENPYVFPPVQIIPKVLQKLRAEVSRAVMFVPEWTSRPWWNLFRMHVLRWKRLGRSAEVLTKGPSIESQGLKLPPGFLVMAELSFSQ
jgi:hypothetical protein